MSRVGSSLRLISTSLEIAVGVTGQTEDVVAALGFGSLCIAAQEAKCSDHDFVLFYN
jgi:hypothetical protein